nr:diguanylate cyclase [Clostridia bacterium]
MIQEIYIIDGEDSLFKKLNTLFYEEDNFCFTNIKEQKLEIALKNIPALIIIHEDTLQTNIIDICNKIRENDDNRITPVIVISSNTDYLHRIEVFKASVEQYIKKPINEQYLYYTIKNLIRLLDINRTVSPLTGLPGNVQIQAEMKKRLMNKEKFVMLYLDLDNFKAYNDVYGFLKGDEIIKFTARTILKNVHDIDLEKGFVGHIGGDDFIAIISNNDYEKLCQNIILDFDYNVLNYYTEEHIEKGYIEVENRKGTMEQFPLTSISIGVVEVDRDNFKNILEIGEVGAQVKHLSKSIQGSTYVVNKRKTL